MTSQTRKEKERFEKRSKKPEEDKIKFKEKIKKEVEKGRQRIL